LQLDGEQQNISLFASISQLQMSGEVSSLISLQPIQQQLDAYEINAWQKLVQVFTHEIMNSMTPVTSLGNTAQALLAEAQQGELPPSASERIEDARQAMHTLNRRTDHLMKFVQAYQRIANPPRLQRQPLDIARLFEHLCELFADQTQAKGVRLVSQVIPMNLQFSLDGVQLEQALINLLKNSLEALAQKQEALGNNFCAEIVLRASLGQQSNLVIDVEDNGVGVDESKRDQIFVPFYTSKPEGSGIGLYLVKQIVQAHGGSVRALPRAGGGAVFRLAFY
jgi:signal transduction histidine kinase